MSNVIHIGGITKLDIPADQILEGNMGLFESVIIIGYDKDENERFCSSLADDSETLWLLERFKKALLEYEDAGLP